MLCASYSPPKQFHGGVCKRVAYLKGLGVIQNKNQSTITGAGPTRTRYKVLITLIPAWAQFGFHCFGSKRIIGIGLLLEKQQLHHVCEAKKSTGAFIGLKIKYYIIIKCNLLSFLNQRIRKTKHPPFNIRFSSMTTMKYHNRKHHSLISRSVTTVLTAAFSLCFPLPSGLLCVCPFYIVYVAWVWLPPSRSWTSMAGTRAAHYFIKVLQYIKAGSGLGLAVSLSTVVVTFVCLFFFFLVVVLQRAV